MIARAGRCGCAAPAGAPRRTRRGRGVLLLEVLLSLVLLVVGLAVVGLQIQKALQAARLARERTRAAFLLESKLAEFDARLIQPELERYGTFGLGIPNLGWALHVEPTEIPDVFFVTLSVFEADLVGDEDLGEMPEGARVLATAYTWRATPATIDLTGGRLAGGPGSNGLPGSGGAGGGQGTSGLPPGLEELLAMLEEVLGETGLDLSRIDPSVLAKLPLDALQDVLPMLVGVLGQSGVDQLLGQAGLGGGGSGSSGLAGGAGGGSSGSGAAGGDAGGGAGSGQLPANASLEEQMQFMQETIRRLQEERGGGRR